MTNTRIRGSYAIALALSFFGIVLMLAFAPSAWALTSDELIIGFDKDLTNVWDKSSAIEVADEGTSLYIGYPANYNLMFGDSEGIGFWTHNYFEVSGDEDGELFGENGAGLDFGEGATELNSEPHSTTYNGVDYTVWGVKCELQSEEEEGFSFIGWDIVDDAAQNYVKPHFVRAKNRADASLAAKQGQDSLQAMRYGGDSVEVAINCAVDDSATADSFTVLASDEGAIAVDEKAYGNGVLTFTVTPVSPTVDDEQYILIISAQTDSYKEGVLKLFVKVEKAASAVSLSDKTAAYTGQPVEIGSAAVEGSAGAVSYAYFSDEGCTQPLEGAPTEAGVYYAVATVEADENYEGAVSAPAKLTIEPKSDTPGIGEDPGSSQASPSPSSDNANKEDGANAAVAKKAINTMTVKAKTVTLKASKVKKKNQTVKVSKAIVVKNAKGSVTFSKKSGNKKITVAKNGKITVKKELKKGTYKVKVKVAAAGNGSFASAAKIVTVKIVVK